VTGAICRSPRILGRRVMRCGSCKRRRRFVDTFCGWWGGHVTCCTCGLQYGEIMRARSKRQRAKAAEGARRDWREALNCAEFEAAVVAEITRGAS